MISRTFDKMLGRWGYLSKRDSLSLREKVASLNIELEEMQEKFGKRLVVDMKVGDPAPENEVARREYIARCAAFYKDVMETKSRQMISEINAVLGSVENSREFDLVLKGTLNALHLWRDWGEMCISEMLSYGEEEGGELEDEELQELKDKMLN